MPNFGPFGVWASGLLQGEGRGALELPRAKFWTEANEADGRCSWDRSRQRQPCSAASTEDDSNSSTRLSKKVRGVVRFVCCWGKQKSKKVGMGEGVVVSRDVCPWCHF